MAGEPSCGMARSQRSVRAVRPEDHPVRRRAQPPGQLRARPQGEPEASTGPHHGGLERSAQPRPMQPREVSWGRCALAREHGRGLVEESARGCAACGSERPGAPIKAPGRSLSPDLTRRNVAPPRITDISHTRSERVESTPKASSRRIANIGHLGVAMGQSGVRRSEWTSARSGPI
jgi:hypothetical protein